VEPGGRCDELLGTYDNLYADISMGSGFNAITRDVEYSQGFLERHHEKLLFGTDYLYPGQNFPSSPSSTSSTCRKTPGRTSAMGTSSSY
jgi:hypothetical protein